MRVPPPPKSFPMKKICQKYIAYQEQLTLCVSCQRTEVSKLINIRDIS